MFPISSLKRYRRGFLNKSITLISGSAGTGKSTIGMQFLLEGAKRREPGIYVTVEEGGAQILNTADALGVPLRKAVQNGLVEIVYLSRQRVRAAQFPAILKERIKNRKAQRLVLDSASHLIRNGLDNVTQLLYRLAVSFKATGITEIFTLESKFLFSAESVTERELSSIADNLLMLRYVSVNGALRPALTLVKTRGTPHDRSSYFIEVARGGMRIGEKFDRPAPEPRPPKAGSVPGNQE